MVIPIIGDLIDGVKDLVGKTIVDKDKKLAIDLELARLQDQAQSRLDGLVSQQIDVNKVEAASGSLFVAGWRPAVGWVCAAGLAAQSILIPLIAQITGRTYEINSELLIMTLGGMLGMGTMRTIEKIRGVSTNDYTDVPKPTPDTTKAPEAVPPKPKHFHIF
jgi:hypothetical protein